MSLNLGSIIVGALAAATGVGLLAEAGIVSASAIGGSAFLGGAVPAFVTATVLSGISNALPKKPCPF